MQLFKRVGKGDAVRKALLVKAGDLFHLIMHALEIDRLDVYGKLLGGLHVLIQSYRAYFYDLPAQMYGEFVENGGFGAHSLIPFQIHHYVIHMQSYPL